MTRTSRCLNAKQNLRAGLEQVQTYAMTDGVTDEQFDLAVAVAKDEGNLSRANMVRKVTRAPRSRRSRPARWEQIAEFAERGFTSPQIAKTIGLSETHVRRQAAPRRRLPRGQDHRCPSHRPVEGPRARTVETSDHRRWAGFS